MRVNYRPLRSLQVGCWFKLICGASYQHLPSIRNLALAYALAGADCIDVAADPAVVSVVREALSVVSHLRQSKEFLNETSPSFPDDLPFLMVSFSDGDDPHFRKAVFNPKHCPEDCSRPCERICPAEAIAFNDSFSGVIEARCYGCGRCLPVCPIQHIEAVTRPTSVSAIAPELLSQVDAIEIHTQVGRYEDFMALWWVIKPYLNQLKVISVSCPDHPFVSDYLWQLYKAIQPLPMPLIWQTDGRPMSGDLGKGTTHATVRYGQKILQTGPPGFVQLAGGTNAHTATKLKQLADNSDLVESGSPQPEIRTAPNRPSFGGIAYGSFARRLLSPLLDETLPQQTKFVSTSQLCNRNISYDLNRLESFPLQLLRAVQLAQSLVVPLKTTYSTQLAPLSEPVGHSLSDVEALRGSSPHLSSFE
ncbi:LdpA C-terminal domain-containing domain [Oscillatoria sp. CS-180]|uniref:circadian clock protein LdpA n=1 Tax=Oscillatoria sp. CS-180 TaxID=3021720 RepID=UPI00232F78FD|nr:LdpA C-terminal domain-containing domain [Oscillatoria sp. CS-180]MDB9524614.1 LdpA C-terminal domain-containing domain [Oscillatoria sp. CS-180]